MAMRLSGLMSGMDTESIIQQLVDARKVKVDNTKKAQTKLDWKRDAWKELNTKLKNLQSKFVSNMRFSEAYSKKTTKVSNSSVVSVITGKDAVNGVQSLQVNQLAKTAYLTGAELKKQDGTKGDYSALTKLSELGVNGDGTFTVKTGKGNVEINVNENTTISDVLGKLKDAGLNASFDAKSQRFFISAKESGTANDFSITASDATGAAALSKLGLATSLVDDAASRSQYESYARYNVAGDRDATIAKIMDESTMIQDEVASREASYLKKYESLQDSKAKLEQKYENDPLDTVANYEAELETKNGRIRTIEEAMAGGTLTEQETRDFEDELVSLREDVATLSGKKSDAQSLADINRQIDEISGANGYVTITPGTDAEGNPTYTAEATDKLRDEVKDKYYNIVSSAATALEGYEAERAARESAAANGTEYFNPNAATKISGQDAIITLNGARFTNSSNVFEINGLTFTALSETKAGETVTVTTQNDTDGIYDMIKDFFKEYNSIINEMDKLYNAPSAKGYEPMTTEEKDALSDREVEEYEKKIKDALLRRDSNLYDVSSALKGVLSAGITVNGKKMYLSDFGINKASYFSAADNEKNAYHIDGDSDDGVSAGNADVLKGLIASDPDTVISFFSQMSKNLYSKMSDMSRSVDGYRSFGSFYDDKKMQTDYNDYTSKIADLEAKLNAYEDKWYARFAKMETAMAKMQDKSNAIAGLLGGKS